MINHINQTEFLTSQIIYFSTRCFNNLIDFLAINMKFHSYFIHYSIILINYVNITVNIAYFSSKSSHINHIYSLLLVFLKYTYSIVTYLSHLQICSEIVTLLLKSITFCIITHCNWYYLHISYYVNRSIYYMFQPDLRIIMIWCNRMLIS